MSENTPSNENSNILSVAINVMKNHNLMTPYKRKLLDIADMVDAISVNNPNNAGIYEKLYELDEGNLKSE